MNETKKLNKYKVTYLDGSQFIYEGDRAEVNEYGLSFFIDDQLVVHIERLDRKNINAFCIVKRL